MPARLVILAEEVLFQGGTRIPGRGWFDALARLAHAGHPVAVILAGGSADSHAPRELQQLAQEAGGQVVAFFHRPPHADGLVGVLDEVTARWRVDPAQLHGVFSRPEDLATVTGYGAMAVALANPDHGQVEPPSGCRMHADLGAFVDALLADPDAGA